MLNVVYLWFLLVFSSHEELHQHTNIQNVHYVHCKYVLLFFFAFGQKFDVEALISRLVIKKPLFVFGLYQHSVGKQIPILQEYFYNISVFSAKKKT